MADDEINIRPGQSRDSDARAYRKAGSLVGRVLQVSRRSGYTPLTRGRAGGGGEERRKRDSDGDGARSLALLQRNSRVVKFGAAAAAAVGAI